MDVRTLPFLNRVVVQGSIDVHRPQGSPVDSPLVQQILCVKLALPTSKTFLKLIFGRGLLNHTLQIFSSMANLHVAKSCFYVSCMTMNGNSRNLECKLAPLIVMLHNSNSAAH